MIADAHVETDVTAPSAEGTNLFLPWHRGADTTHTMIHFFTSYSRVVASHDGTSDQLGVAYANLLRYDNEPDESPETHAEFQRPVERVARLFLGAYEDPITTTDHHKAALSEDSPSDSDAVAIEDRLRLLIYEARDQQFEDGMDSQFSMGLRSVVMSYGSTTVGVIAKHWHTMAKMYPKEFSEILVQFGRMDHGPTRAARRSLIESALQHPDAGLRDAAALGLDALGDPASEQVLRKAIRSESVPAIREMLNATLQDLSQPS